MKREDFNKLCEEFHLEAFRWLFSSIDEFGPTDEANALREQFANGKFNELQEPEKSNLIKGIERVVYNIEVNSMSIKEAVQAVGPFPFEENDKLFSTIIKIFSRYDFDVCSYKLTTPHAAQA
jgi:hypothetical protein